MQSLTSDMGKAKRKGGLSVLKSRPDSVGAGGGGKGLSLPSHFTQKISEMSANDSVGFENRGSVMKAPHSLVRPNTSQA